MYKILIVDDERMIRMGIEKTINWKSLKIGEVYTAASAREAMEMIEKYKPNILITDISMTEMSGLDLVGIIREQESDMRIIILTGYDRFDYARQALQLQVHDFLLKPIDERELTESIRMQIQKIEEIKEEKQRTLNIKRTEGVYQQEYLESVIWDYMKGNTVEAQREQEFLQQFGFERNEMMRIGIVIPDKKTDQSSDEEKFYHQMMKQIAMNLIDDCNKGITITDGENHLIIVFFSGYGEEKFDTSSEAEELMDILRNECNAEPKLVFGSEVSGFKNLQVSYNDALYVVKSERKEIADVFYSKTYSKRNDIFQEVFREFKQACILNCSNIEQVMHILKRFKRAVESYNLGRKYAINCYFELASAIYFSYINETGNTPEESLNSFTQSLVGTDKEKAEEVTEMFLQKILAKEEGDEHEIIRKVKNMIHEDLSQDLTVANLAAQLYVSPNYLSRLFKQITGEGCNEYIVRKRIEKAKSLLETTSLKTGEIAMMVGYHDMNYFSLAFKKHIGKAPTKYRNIVQKQERADS